MATLCPLRAATSADIPAIVELVDAAYRHYIAEMGGRRPRPMDDDQASRVANGELFVLEQTGTLLGVITMQRQPDSIHIFNLAIRPEDQERGLLHHLIGFAEATAPDEHKPRLTLIPTWS